MNKATQLDLGAEALSILRDELGVEPVEHDGLLFLRCRKCGNEWIPYPGSTVFGRFVGAVSSKQLTCTKCVAARSSVLCLKGGDSGGRNT